MTPTGYERALVRQVRNFARAAGCPAKTDALDAQMLAHYGTVFAVAHPVAPPVEKQADRETLKDLLRQRKPLVDQRVQERHRLDKGLTAGVHNSTQRHIQWLDEEIKRLDQAYQKVLAQSPRLAAQAALYQSLPGVGALTAAMLVGYRPELGTVPDRAGGLGPVGARQRTPARLSRYPRGPGPRAAGAILGGDPVPCASTAVLSGLASAWQAG